MEINERERSDLLMGAREIGEFLDMTDAQVYHAARLKRLPIGKMGKTLIASRRALQRAIDKLVSA